VTAALLALALALAAPLAQEEWQPPPAFDDDEEDAGGRPRFFLSAWGGQALEDGGGGPSHGVLGGEVAWAALEHLDLGLAGYGYRGLPEAVRATTPVALVRLIQRYPTRAGVEATFTVGIGAARPDDWVLWLQVALGVRVVLGPLFLGGELAFEQYDLLRLTGGLGVSF
jgi:hypothetical protein